MTPVTPVVRPLAILGAACSGRTGLRSIVRTWRVLPLAVRTTADGMTPVLIFSIVTISPA